MNSILDFSNSDEICSVAIGVEPLDFTHCGMLYKTNNGSYFLHLGNPLQLINEREIESPNTGYRFSHDKYKWLPFKDIHSSLLVLIKTKCIAIAEQNKALPYGIYVDEDTNFDAHGNLIMGRDSTGLTCATFIRLLLKSSHINIINDEDWPDDRDEDLIWLQKIISIYENWRNKFRKEIIENLKLLKKSNNKEEKININQRNKDLSAQIDILNHTISNLKEGKKSYFKRFRPEEVSGVCYKNFNEFPFKFDEIDRDGARLIGENLLNVIKS